LACVAVPQAVGGPSLAGCRTVDHDTNKYCRECEENYYFAGTECITGAFTPTQPSLTTDKFCMGNQEGANTEKCASCYNNEGATNKAKAFGGTEGADAYTCKARVRNVDNCQVYSNMFLESTMAATDCKTCQKGKKHVITAPSATVTADTCQDSWPTDTNNVCTGTVDGCDAENVVCWHNAQDQTTPYIQGCTRCQTGKVGSGTALPFGWPSCVAAAGESDCDIGDSADATKCYQCKSGKYVSEATGLCVTVATTLANCRVVDAASGTYCQECAEGYYFNGKACFTDPVQPSLAKTLYCLGNQQGDNEAKCASCYNYEGSTTPAKAFSGTSGSTAYTCVNRTRNVDNCQVYNKLFSNETSAMAATDCLWCKDGFKHVITAPNAVVTADTCQAAWPTGAAACTGTIDGCVANSVVCWHNDQDQTNPYVQGCGRCQAGKVGDGTQLPFGYTACKDAASTSNCSVSSSTNKDECYVCKDNYLV
jgi:hypothetical protein